MNSLSFGTIALAILIIVSLVKNGNEMTESEMQISVLKAENAALSAAIKTLKEINNGTL
jgi:hypothetical protein